MHGRRKILICIVGGLFGFAMQPAVQATLITYDAPGDLAANFNLNHAGAGNKYFETTSGGLGGTRAIGSLGATDGPHTSAVYNQQSFDFDSTGDSVTVSQYFLRQDATLLITNFSIPQIGIFTDNTELFGNNAAGNSYASLRLLSSTSNNTDVFLQTEIKSGTGIRQQVSIPGTASLVAGNWYRLTTTLENVSATQVEISGALEDWGTTGAAFVSNILSTTGNVVSFSGSDLVLGDSTVWAGQRFFTEGGALRVDNFEVTPEPSTFGLLCLGGLLVARRRR